MSAPPKHLIVYDLDGTLVDTAEDITEAINAMLTELSVSALSRDEIRSYVGRGLHDLVGRCLNTEDPALLERGLRSFVAYYGAHMTDHSRLYPGAREALEHFKSRLQVIFTNKPNPYAKDLMDKLGVGGYFTDILAGGTPRKKPDPSALLDVMRRLRVSPEEALIVGDSLIDVQTGRNAGILTVILGQGFEDREALAAAKPDVMVDHMQAFLALAKERGW